MGQLHSKRVRQFYANWLKPVFVVVVVLSCFRSAIADWNDVPTQSMEPTILVGDRIFVNKLAYGLKFPFTTFHLARWDTPDRGEIVVFYAPGNGVRTVKRVVAVPGDRIALRENQLVINDQSIKQIPASATDLNAYDLTDPEPIRFVREDIGAGPYGLMWQPARMAMRSFGPLTIPSGHFFVMGDNRDNSADSRYFGLVSRDQIVGRVVGIAFSLDRDMYFKPRWDRFFKGVK